MLQEQVRKMRQKQQSTEDAALTGNRIKVFPVAAAGAVDEDAQSNNWFCGKCWAAGEVAPANQRENCEEKTDIGP